MPPELQLVQQWLDSQQAVEKALKAFLVYHQVESAWTHQISLLLELCAKCEGAFTRFVATAVPLTECAVRFRYPLLRPGPSPEKVRTALDVARDVIETVIDLEGEGRLGPGGRRHVGSRRDHQERRRVAGVQGG